MFLAGILYAFWILESVTTLSFANFGVFCIIGTLLVCFLYKSISVGFDFMLIWLLFTFYDHELPAGNTLAYLPLVLTVLIFTAYKIKSKFAILIVWAVTAVFVLLGNEMPYGEYKYWNYFVSVAVTLEIIVYTINGLYVFRKPNKVDVLLCSYSGNTAHYTGHFIDGMKSQGTEVITHRFHYHKDFNAEMTGDALVVAFPVIGWRPSWPVITYIIRRLPWGKGKPVFIIYTAAGGPENTGIFMWLLMTLKGYRVAGKNWAVYPMNVVTFRLGPSRMWRFFDKLIPTGIATNRIREDGVGFARGEKTGTPIIVFPFLLVVISVILENRWVNIPLYRNYAWRRRCIKCGLCVRYCPEERLSMVNGYPKAKGTCVLCLGCINLCPKNAMQMVCWSEYGNPYRPKWPELVVKRR